MTIYIAFIIGAAIVLSVLVNFQDPASWRGAVAGLMIGLAANGVVLSPAVQRHGAQAPVESSTFSASCLEQKRSELRRAAFDGTKPGEPLVLLRRPASDAGQPGAGGEVHHGKFPFVDMRGLIGWSG
jgi:hypothetical protein